MGIDLIESGGMTVARSGVAGRRRYPIPIALLPPFGNRR
jgi:hypothetical protein